MRVKYTKHNGDLYGKLPDSGWTLLNITNSNWENFSWEPLAYRRIGDICYIHGAGTLKNIASLTNKAICTIPYDTTGY